MCYRKYALFATVVAVLIGLVSSRDRFYAIAHMTHTKKAVKFAMDVGANAIEVDLNFNKITGEPTRFYHGSPCDCTCYKFDVFSRAKSGGNICGLDTHPCKTESDYGTLLDYISGYSEKLALVYVDCKISGFPDAIQKKAAHHTVRMLEDKLFKNGYRGKVVVTAAREKTFVRNLAEYSVMSTFNSKIYVSLDWNDKGIDDTLKFLTSLSTRNTIYSQGNSVCNPRTYHRVTRSASANRMNGVISSVFIWTVDSEKSYSLYYSFGARGIITNKIEQLVSWVKKNGIILAAPGDHTLKPSWSKRIIDPTCDCQYSSNGCVIKKLPPPNTACQCKKIFTKCSGRVTMCSDPNALACKHPGHTQKSCIQGRGNCDGYRNQQCDCSVKWNWGFGCVVTKPAPIHTACRCSLGFGCHGHVVNCKNPNDSHCVMPDRSRASCQLGGGNCKGY